jgi:hypothetical protein
MAVQRARRRREPPVDRVPELTHYRDEGCVVWHACLTCPLPRCIYDDPRQGRGAANRLRDAEIARLAREGWSARALAARYQVTRRHVFRILRREREG